MRKFVSPNSSLRRPQKRLIIRTESKKASWWQLFFFFYWKQIVWALLLIWCWYAFFFHNWAPIQHIVFTQQTQDTLSYQALFDRVSQDLKGKWYYKQKRREWRDWSISVQESFPLINRISPISFDNGTLTIDIGYHNPDFIMYSQENQPSIVYHNMFIPYNSWALIWATGIQLQVALPQEKIDQFSWWVFWATSSQDIVRTIKKINFLSGSMVYTYFPGLEKLSIKTEKDTFIIGLQKEQMNATFEQWKHIIPYLPTAIPALVDISNPDRIIIKQ